MPDVVTLHVVGSDSEARKVGLPTVGVHEAVIGRVAAALIKEGCTVMVDEFRLASTCSIRRLFLTVSVHRQLARPGVR